MRCKLALWAVLLILPMSPCLADAALTRLLEALEGLRQEHDVPGLALTLVDQDGSVWSGALGVADRATGRPASADTLFRIGSITKVFTALAAVLLQQQGRLDITAPVRTLAPDIPLRNPWSDSDPVRLVHLLEHSAGLLDLTRSEFDFNQPVSLAAGLAVAPEARVCRWPPGRHSSYSNAGYGLAGYVLEQVSGVPWERLVTERVLKPLGMVSASLSLDARTRRSLATGYDSDGHTVIPYWHMIFRPFGAINASPRQMAALIRLFLNDGRVHGRQLLSRAAIRRMERPTTTLAARGGLAYGYGLGNYAFSHQGFLFHGHGGDGDGYLSHFAYNRDSARGYFLVINAYKGHALRAMRRAIQDHIVRDLKPPAPPPAASLSEESLRGLTGTYEVVTWRFEWQGPDRHPPERLAVVWRDGGLHTRDADGSLHPLIPVSARHFRRPGEPVASIAFVPHEGALYLQGDLGNYRRVPAP